MKDTSTVEQASTVKYYMPHHPVIRDDKQTTKLRIVFDVSSHEEGSPSLNDCLLIGPNLNPDLLHVLIKFRLHKVAFTADIAKAFLQIGLKERDRDIVRFLWTYDPSSQNSKREPCIMRMNRVVFGVASSPFLLAATIRTHLKQYGSEQPATVALLQESLYVDDLIVSLPDVDEACFISAQAKAILSAAGMELRKWTTNSSDLRTRWIKDQIESPADSETHNTALRLGLIWRHDHDDFVFDLRQVLDVLERKESTKRSVLQISSRIFDPIGFLTPYTIRVKCLFQEMWERGLKWDEELPPDLAHKWKQWCDELSQLHLVAIPRWYNILTDQQEKTRLHVFCDASERAYCAVGYLQGKSETAEIISTLVTSKSRVAPLKKMTLPRLELMGALIGARLAHNLLKALKIRENHLYMWTDSMIALNWIRSSAQKWKPFVANRVTEIQSLTKLESWSHCDGKHTPTDLPTRGQAVNSLIDNQLWWNGPDFLQSVNPVVSVDVELPEEEVNAELRSKFQVAVQFSSTDKREPLLDLCRYSKLNTVLRITAWVQRFVTNTCSSIKNRGELSAEELMAAEVYWVRMTQEETFEREMNLLKDGQCVHKDSKIKELKPFLDEKGLISVGGRLQLSDLNFREQHPWILPAKHRYCELLIQKCHEKSLHSGTRDTLMQVRDRFWILKGRQLVKQIVGRCPVCKKFKAKPAQQATAPLPRDRVI